MLEMSTVASLALRTSLLILTGTACALLAHRSAAHRHLLWTAALALSLLLPIA